MIVHAVKVVGGKNTKMNNGMEGFRKMKIEDDDIISLNWDLFDKHITKCKKCQKIQQEYFIDIWDHIRGL